MAVRGDRDQHGVDPGSHEELVERAVGGRVADLGRQPPRRRAIDVGDPREPRPGNAGRR